MDNGRLFVGVVTYVTFASVLTCTRAQGSTSGFVDQWVTQVTAFSSEYTFSHNSYVIGPPYEGKVWLPSGFDSYQFLELKYREKVYVTSVDVYESGFGLAGQTRAILAEDECGNWITLWNATQCQCVRNSRIFSPILKKFRFMTDHIRIVMNCTICRAHMAIDAVKLEGRRQPPDTSTSTACTTSRITHAATSSVTYVTPDQLSSTPITQYVTPITQGTASSTQNATRSTTPHVIQASQSVNPPYYSASTVQYPTKTAGWTSASSSASLTCFQCRDVSHLELCDNIETCGQNEVCYMEGYTNVAGHKHYKSGCKDAVRCETERTNADPATECVRCCRTPFCNSAGCGDSGFPAPWSRGPICYDCQHVRSVDECHTVAVCQPGQVCSIEEYPLGDHSHFKIGCVHASVETPTTGNATDITFTTVSASCNGILECVKATPCIVD